MCFKINSDFLFLLLLVHICMEQRVLQFLPCTFGYPSAKFMEMSSQLFKGIVKGWNYQQGQVMHIYYVNTPCNQSCTSEYLASFLSKIPTPQCASMLQNNQNGPLQQSHEIQKATKGSQYKRVATPAFPYKTNAPAFNSLPGLSIKIHQQLLYNSLQLHI